MPSTCKICGGEKGLLGCSNSHGKHNGNCPVFNGAETEFCTCSKGDEESEKLEHILSAYIPNQEDLFYCIGYIQDYYYTRR